MNNDKTVKIYKTVMLIIVVALITFILTSTYIYNKFGTTTTQYSTLTKGEGDILKKINLLKNIINQKYISSDINEDDLVEGAIAGYVSGLGDEYTQYFPAKEMEEFTQETEGNYVGIGIYMYKNTIDNTIVVLYPIENSPAEEAGIQTGDIIKKVDNVEYTGNDMDKVSSYIKGKEGTKVQLEIERKGETLNIEVERKKIDLYPMKSEILENDIGYIKVASFDSGCAEEFESHYKELSKNNMSSLIIDLRDNGGGMLKETEKIAEYILEKDSTILITVDKDGKEKIEKASKKPTINLPIIVLTNENTASASEILAGALKENGKATIIGEKTYGKGVIQELISLSDGSGIKVTTEEYYTPNRNKINKIGITPDKEVSLPENILSLYKISREDDTQLLEAMNELKNK